MAQDDDDVHSYRVIYFAIILLYLKNMFDWSLIQKWADGTKQNAVKQYFVKSIFKQVVLEDIYYRYIIYL